MAAEAVLQLRRPGVHQSQLCLARNPAPLCHLGSGGLRGPISTGEAGEGGLRPQLEPTWPPTCTFPPPAVGAWPLSSCSCSSQTPPQPVARGLVSSLWVGTTSVGVVLAQTKAPLHPSPEPLPQSPAWAEGIVLGGLTAWGADLSQS